MKKRVFLTVYSITNTGLMPYGLLLLWMPAVLLTSLSLAITRFPDSDFWIDRLLPLFRLLGYLNLLLGAVGLFLILCYQVSGQPGLGYAVVAFSILAYLGPIVYDNTAGTLGPFEILELIIFTAMILSGLTIIKEFKSRSEKIHE